MSLQKSDVLIIGGGIVGASLAQELQSKGKQVIVMDRGPVGEGCSFANAGWVTPCFAMPLPQPGMFFKSIKWLMDSQSPLHIKPELNPTLFRWMFHFLKAMNERQMLTSAKVLAELSIYSLKFYKDLAARSKIDLGFKNSGLVMASATQEGLDLAKLEMEVMAEHGIDGQFMNRDEILSFEPALRPLIQGGVYFPQEAHIEPYMATLGLMEEFVSLGGKLYGNTEVYDFEVSNKKISKVHTTQGDFSADLVILATGSWTSSLARKLKLRIPILGGKGYSMSLNITEKKPQRPIMIIEKKIAVTPRANSTRIAGTLELVDQDFSISEKRLKAIQNGAKEYLHIPENVEIKEIWRGLRPCTPDGVPIIGPSKKISNLFYNCGHQMLGLQSAPGSAKLSSDLIFGKTPSTDPKPFSADRFE